MKVRRTRVACLSAAVAALTFGGLQSHARDLTWDSDGAAGALGQDGTGTWDEATTPNWVDGDLITGTNVTWDSTIPDSAIFGNGISATGTLAVTNTVSAVSPITVQNMTIGTGTNGGVYTINDAGGGSITLAGNIDKNTGFGAPQIILFNGPLTLTAGQHTIAANDTGGDALPEFRINAPITGPGGVTINNGTYVTWGSTAFNIDNDYTGATNIDKGRLIITTAGALGDAGTGTTIGALGTLSIGGANQTVPTGLDLAEPITITRNTYTQPESTYGYALITQNGTGTHSLSGGLIVDSTDARISVNSSRLIIPGAITQGPTIGVGGAGKVSFTGDFGGFVELQGDNSALLGGFEFRNGVEVQATSQANIGGPNSILNFVGDATLGIMNGFMTDFGTHVVNYGSFSGGLNIPAGQTFNLTTPITGGAGLGKRGTGTLNFNAGMTGTGNIFWDGGIVNVNAPVTLGALRLRSPVVNIGTGGSVTTTSAFNSFGADSTGTNGGPDKAIVNITGNGQLIQTNNVDFNVSDNANTEGTINLGDNGLLQVAGLMHVGKSVGGKGTINQTGGQFTLTRNANFTLVLGSRRGTGIYNMSGGTMTSAGEFYVGQGQGADSGTGSFTMTGGTVNQNNWFVLGRENGTGTVAISGSSIFTKAGGGSTEIDASAGPGPSSMTVSNTAEYRANTGDVRVGQGGGAIGTLTIKDTAKLIVAAGELQIGNAAGNGTVNLQDGGSISTNNWTAIGRDNGTGTLNQTGGSVTKTGTGNNFLIATNAGNAARNLGVGTYNLSGGTFTNTTSETWINEGATLGTWNISGTGAATTGIVDVHHLGVGTGVLNVSGTGSLTATSVRVGQAGTGSGTVNLDGGTIAANQVIGGGTSGTKTFNFNGGTLRARQDQTQFMQGLTVANVQNGGAIIDSNGFNVTIAQPLVGGVSTGGLTKNGAGTVSLSAAANVYNGPTTVNAGTLQVADTGSKNNALKGGALTIAPAARLDLTNNKLITTTAPGTESGGIYSGVQGEVQRASNGGAWDQPGLTTSQPDAAGGLTSIGVATGEQILGLGPTDTALFAGQTINGASTVAMYTYAGDANMDGFISGDDYAAIDLNVAIPGSDGWYNGDFNYDGIISGDDYAAIDLNIVTQGAPFPTGGSAAGASLSGVTAVPEPTSISLVALAGASLLGRRRRRAPQLPNN